MFKWLITLLLALLVLGLLSPLANRLGLGRLPGDFRVRRGQREYYFPITSTVLASLALTLLAWIFRL